MDSAAGKLLIPFWRSQLSTLESPQHPKRILFTVFVSVYLRRVKLHVHRVAESDLSISVGVNRWHHLYEESVQQSFNWCGR